MKNRSFVISLRTRPQKTSRCILSKSQTIQSNPIRFRFMIWFILEIWLVIVLSLTSFAVKRLDRALNTLGIILFLILQQKFLQNTIFD